MHAKVSFSAVLTVAALLALPALATPTARTYEFESGGQGWQVQKRNLSTAALLASYDLGAGPGGGSYSGWVSSGGNTGGHVARGRMTAVPTGATGCPWSAIRSRG